MQQTSFDQWLRRKFLFVTQIYCNTLPEDLPEELAVEEADEESGGRYRYTMSTRDELLVADAVECFRMQNVTYTTRVHDRDVWFAKYLNSRTKSMTFRIVWLCMFLALVGFVFSGAPLAIYHYVMDDEEDVEAVEPVNNPEDDIKISTVGATVIEIDRLE
jgi:hypothetical protein